MVMLMTMKMMMAIQLMNSINLTFKIYFRFQKREALLLIVPEEETRALSNESEDIFVKEFSVACDVKYIGQDRSSGFSITDFNFVLMWIWVLIFSLVYIFWKLFVEPT